MVEISQPAAGLSRRSFLQAVAVGATGVAAAATGLGTSTMAVAAPSAGGPVGRLRVAGRVDSPLGVDDRSPLLAWQSERGSQAAYQVRVASSVDQLGSPDLWHTGWVESDVSTGVTYDGAALDSRQPAVWQVRVRDTDGTVSDWSEPSRWEMGLLDPSDWSPAVWIEHAGRTDADPLPIFARPFTVDTEVSRARLHIAGLGVYLATVNGQKVGEDVLAPGDSNAQQSVEAATYDVTDLLVPGKNTLGIQLGNGITNVVDITNPEVGREDTYAKFESDIPTPTELAGAVSAGDVTITVADADGFAVGATVNVDTGGGGENLESRIITGVGDPGSDATVVTVAEPFAEEHAAGATVTRSGTANATTTAISPRFIARLEIVDVDGATETIVTDRGWKTALGPTVTDNWYSGTDYDARREQPGWDGPGADLSASATRRDGTTTGWETAGIAPPPSLSTRLTWRRGEPVTIVDTVSPAEITEPVPGTWVFDFGQNATALYDLHVDGLPAGTVIKLQPSETLSEDGTVDAGSMGSNDDVFETYTTAGDPDGETWRAPFVHHGFQYLQVTGLPDDYPVSEEMLTALHTRAGMPVSGDVSTDSDIVNRLHRMSQYSIASNMQSIFTDCPNREKLGWLADMLQSIQAIDRNFAMAAYLPHMQQVMREAQVVDGDAQGLVPGHVPEFPVFGGGYRLDINWGGAVILTPWWLWQRHGDTVTMARNYESMVEYHDYIRREQEGADGIGQYLVHAGLGDWIAHDESTPTVLVGTWGYFLITDAMAQMAAELGHNDDARRYEELAGNIRTAFNARFFNDSLGAYTNEGNDGTEGTQTANALALDSGLVPEGAEQSVLDSLVERIYAYHPNGGGPHVSGGTIGLGPTFRSLNHGGRDDVIWEVLQETTRPSYGAYLQPSVLNPHGMTTIPEHWYSPDRNSSLNHMILLQIDEWFSAGLAGILHVPGSIAYGEVEIRPRLVGTDEYPLTEVDGYFDGPRGQIRSTWSLGGRSGRNLTLDVTIPANTVARIHVPAMRSEVVRLDGRPPRVSGRVEFESFSDGYAIYTAGPGTYHFTSRVS